MSDLATLSDALVVAVHVNDAPEGLRLESYDDHDRRLPTETGVIDLAGFMQGLAALGLCGAGNLRAFQRAV